MESRLKGAVEPQLLSWLMSPQISSLPVCEEQMLSRHRVETQNEGVPSAEAEVQTSTTRSQTRRRGSD